MCEIACSTEGARIFYTLNGNAPTSYSTRYAGAFYITGSCTVKAIALLSGCLDSEVAVKTVTKEWTIGDTMGTPDHAFMTSGDGDKAFYRVADASAPNGEAMHSGDIGNSSAYGLFVRTVLSTTVTGPGTASFSWRASCEDDAEAEGEDCIWVGGFGWESAEPYTHTTEVPVPYAWLRTYYPTVADEYEAYEAAAKATAANGRKVWECYVVGLDPQDAEGDFRITEFPMKADGTPDLENIAVYPPQAQWNVPGARAVVHGTAELKGEWKAVEGATAAERAAMRFFKVVVEVP